MIVLYTSALIENKFDIRKSQYLSSYNILDKYLDKKNIKIVECFSSDGDFLKSLGSDIIYTNTHNNSIRNKGVLEVMAMKKFFEVFDIDDDEIIFKITGRYTLIDDSFINLINSTNYDFYGRLMDENRQVFTGCFAMRKKIFLDWLNKQDLNILERMSINIEKSMIDYLYREGVNTHFSEMLNIEAPIFGTGEIDFHVL